MPAFGARPSRPPSPRIWSEALRATSAEIAWPRIVTVVRSGSGATGVSAVAAVVPSQAIRRSAAGFQRNRSGDTTLTRRMLATVGYPLLAHAGHEGARA